MTAPPDEQKLGQLLGKMIGDLGAAASGALILVGDKTGLYRGLVEGGRQTSEALAERTGTHERYVREWLAAQAASGYVECDPAALEYWLTPEQAAVFADDGGPAFMAGGYECIAALYKDEPKITAAFKSGAGVGWQEHSQCLFRGTERFFRPGYEAHLVEEWLPALDGVVDKLRAGAAVADVGCGHGVTTLLMAKAFPRSRFHGFDFHEGSIARARELAAQEGLANAQFEASAAKTFPGEGYDLVTFFDCLHDMGDPVGAAQRVRQALAADGTWMIVEPRAGDHLAENLHPFGRLFYSFSTMVCTPASLSQEVGLGLGAQAGEKRLRDVVTVAGFTHFRRAAETPVNMVLEAR